MLLRHTDLLVCAHIRWGEFLSDAISSIAGGFIAGYLFYIFSVLLPKSKRLPPILKLVAQHVRYAKEGLDDKSNTICGKGAKNFRLQKSDYGSYGLTHENCRYILQALEDVRLFIQYPFSQVENLSNKNVELLSSTGQLVIKKKHDYLMI